MDVRKKSVYMKDGWVNSEPLHLVVDTCCQQFVLHESLLIEMSEGMKKEVSCAITEGGGKKLIWPQFEATTVACLIEFAYTGDFMSPGFARIDSDYIVDYHDEMRSYEKPDFNGLKTLEAAWDHFARHNWEYDEQQMDYDVDDRSSVSDALCTVARVYRLAEDFGIEVLEKFCLNKLHRLMVYYHHKLDVVDFLSLSLSQWEMGDLYQLAVKYATLMAEFFKDDKEFKKLLVDEPEFAARVFWHLSAIHRKQGQL